MKKGNFMSVCSYNKERIDVDEIFALADFARPVLAYRPFGARPLSLCLTVDVAFPPDRNHDERRLRAFQGDHHLARQSTPGL